MFVFSIFDSKAEGYLQPFFCVNRGVALRQFMAAIQEESHQFHRFASDYTLFEVAQFDEKSGRFIVPEAFVSLGCAVEFLNVSKPALELVGESR